MLTTSSLRRAQYDHYAYFFIKVTDPPAGITGSAPSAGSAQSARITSCDSPAGTNYDIMPFGIGRNVTSTGITCHIKPAGTYAVAYLKGDYYHCQRTYEALFRWIDSHHKRTGRYSYKEAVIDELATPNMQDYLTKISIQIMD